MFKKEVYINRRKKLSEKIKTGLIIIQGNSESPMNFLHNQYRFRQDSSFLYFFGLNFPDLMGIIDIDNNKEYIGGDDLSIDDIIWTGPQPTLAERSKKVGINNIITTAQIKEFLNKAIKKGRKIHFLPPYRAENKIQIEKLLGIKTAKINDYVSEELIKAVVELRSIKEHEEIEEIERIFDVAYDMHVTAMKMAKKADKYEQDIYGTIEGIALKGGGCPSFPIILTTHGETLHNHYHGLKLEEGKLMLTDAGAESEMGYATDITRTVPVGGKFTEKQKQIYNIVLKAEVECIKAVKPGIENIQIHKLAARIITEGLKEIGIMKGDTNKAVEQGAHAMFFPHGIGHMMGLDVHDMENLGEKYVGYNEETERSKQFGTENLRLGKKLEEGFLITIEPGIYFIPELIKRWKEENKFNEFINYDKVNEYINFGGIRIEDDVLVTKDGYKVIGKPIPKTVEEIEKVMTE